MANPRVPGPRILIGGGIGAGKGAVADRLAGKGITVIEADRIGHEVLEQTGPRSTRCRGAGRVP